MTRSRSLPALAAGLALVLAACGGTTSTTFESVGEQLSDAPTQTEGAAPSEASSEAPSAAAGEEATVRLTGFAFDTEELTVGAGTEVRFVNADSAAHTVTEGTDGVAIDDPIVDEELEQNGATSVTFEEPGTYEITCLFHPSMQMTIVVE
jgi:plastocyanin